MAAGRRLTPWWKYVPETKGRSLEEIQAGWGVKGDRMPEGKPAA
jgi:hypothetical protein